MKVHLLALLASVLVKAAPTEIKLQITVLDGDHKALHALSPPSDISKLVLVDDCEPRANWKKPCRLPNARDGRWLGTCALRADSSFFPLSRFVDLGMTYAELKHRTADPQAEMNTYVFTTD